MEPNPYLRMENHGSKKTTKTPNDYADRRDWVEPSTSRLPASREEPLSHWWGVIKGGTNPEEILKEINKLDKNIKFTLEMEEGGILNFLDVKIIKSDEEIRTTIYRKPTNANHIVNEKYKTSKSYKWAARTAYVNRAIEICSNKELLREEIRAIKTIAKTASFKAYIVDKLYRKHIKKLSIITPEQKCNIHIL